jgi:hypothetical protein
MIAALRPPLSAPVRIALEILWVVTVLLATAALILAAARSGDVLTSRRDAARDSCHLLLGLVQAATPASRRADANAYIAHTSLHNCDAYARHIVP